MKKIFCFCSLLFLMLFLNPTRSHAGVLDAQLKRVEGDCKANIATALALYELDNGEPPSTQEGLYVLFRKPPRSGSYLVDRQAIIDPWGNPYGYRYPSLVLGDTGYDLFSFGPDGQENTADDIKFQIPRRLTSKINVKVDDASMADLISGLKEAISKGPFSDIVVESSSDKSITADVDAADMGRGLALVEQLSACSLFHKVQLKYSKFLEKNKIRFRISISFTDKATRSEDRLIEFEKLQKKMKGVF